MARGCTELFCSINGGSAWSLRLVGQKGDDAGPQAVQHRSKTPSGSAPARPVTMACASVLWDICSRIVHGTMR
eukprot:416693-Pyramimonas_sp.AAC.1